MAKVRILPVPADAYDPSRPASSLLKSQIRQLQDAVLHAVDTEGEAARCIEVLTALLQEVRPYIVPRAYGPEVRRRQRPAPRARARKRVSRTKPAPSRRKRSASPKARKGGRR